METCSNKKLITVITLSYYSEHLMETVNSVLSQKYPSIQYIIADDGTEHFNADYWYQYIGSHQKGNIREVLILHQEENVGTVCNYNNALIHAKGEYIFPLSGDDVYENPHVLDKWVDGFLQHHDPIVCASCSVYDSTLKHFRGKWPRPDQIRLLISRDWKAIYRAMETQKLLPGCTMARSKDSLETLGLFDTEYKLMEDYPFLMKALRKGIPVGFLSSPMVKKRSGGVSDGQSSNSLLEKDMQLFYENEVYPYCEDPDALRKQIKDGTLKRKESALLFQTWEEGTMTQKFDLLRKKPMFVLRRVLRTIFKI